MNFSLRNVSGLVLLFGIFLFSTIWDNISYMNKEPIDFYSEEFSSISTLKKGARVDVDLDLLIGPYATETDTSIRGLLSSDDDYSYYLIPVYVGEETYFISCSISEDSDISTDAKTIADITTAYLTYERDTYTDTPLRFQGGIGKPSDKLYKFMKDFVEDTEWYTDSEIKKYVLPINLYYSTKDSTKNEFYISIACFVLGAAGLIFSFIRNRKEKLEEAAFASSAPVNVANDEYAFRLKQLQALGDKTIEIGGDTFQISKLTYIDRKILTGDLNGAKEYMMNTYYATEEEANTIIQNWDTITKP